MSHENGRVEPDTNEVLERATRRTFTAAYKLEILEKADRCREPGELGALLRQEGLYSSHLTMWRQQRSRAAGKVLGAVKRGRRGPDERDARIAKLEKENARLQARAERAEALVDLQKKVSEILGIALGEEKR